MLSKVTTTPLVTTLSTLATLVVAVWLSQLVEMQLLMVLVWLSQLVETHMFVDITQHAKVAQQLTIQELSNHNA